MSVSGDLLEFLKLQSEEARLQRLLETKGYSTPQDDGFGLNPWTCRLIPRHSKSEGEKQENATPRPDHLVSFLTIPAIWREDLLDTNSSELHSWISEYKWHHIPDRHPPFLQAGVQACSKGLFLPRWVQTADEGWLEIFLLIRRDGVVEFGLGREAYSLYEEGTVFQFIQIVGRLWQYLVFLSNLFERFLPSYSEETLVIVNIRGTEEALLGNLAEGWKQPLSPPYDTYRPRCLDKHLQIQRKISSGTLANDVEDIVRWFATRIDNAWGQFEPRCYVHRKFDESQPFARRKS